MPLRSSFAKELPRAEKAERDLIEAAEGEGLTAACL